MSCGVIGGVVSPLLLGEEGNGIELGVHHYSVRSLMVSGELTLGQFPRFARERLGVSHIEIAEELAADLRRRPESIAELRSAAEQVDVGIHTLLCSAETSLDADSEADRERAVEHHLAWARIARDLGCKFLRVRAGSPGDSAVRLEKAVAGIRRLCDRIEPGMPRVLIENVGGFSRRPDWLLSLVSQVGESRCGVLADYGNFEGDIYEGMKRLLPATESLCTKSWEFDQAGNETKIDFARMGRLIAESKFRGVIAIEWLGKSMGPVEGIRQTAALIRKHL